MTPLLDVNVLVALAWPHHVHHTRAHAWFARVRAGGWATCPLTQSAFVRISCNRAVIPDAPSAGQALDLLRRIVAIPGHVFWADDVEATHESNRTFRRVVGHRQVTDAHLLALALRRGGRLATFDRGIAELVPPGHAVDAALDLIP